MLFLLNRVVVSNIIARIFSGSINFYINKRFVFGNKNKDKKDFIMYVLLAGFILIVNSILLSVMVNYFMVNKYFAKVIVEAMLMIVSFLVQRKVIFY